MAILKVSSILKGLRRVNPRNDGLLKAMSRLNIDAVLLGNGHNSRYISGFTGTSSYVYISKSRQVLLTDFRYIEQAQLQCPEYEVVDYMIKGLGESLKQLAKEDCLMRLGLEEHLITVKEYNYYRELFKSMTFVSIEGLIEKLRMIKDASELEAIRKAASIADEGFTHIIKYIKEGVSERDIALELEFFMRRQGASALSFETIAASGQRSSMPHGLATDKVIEQGDFLTLDFGCVYKGYCSDMTRTVAIGDVSAEQKKVYSTVLEAQLLGLRAIKSGISGVVVDRIARDYIYEAGYEGYFGHGLGHSLGLEVHEYPRLGASGIAPLEANMLVTVEPGIYLPGKFGVRIEDLVLVTEEGHKNLTNSTKELLIV